MSLTKILFIGPPGAGKGTQAELLKTKYDFAHISTGEIIRNSKYKDEIANGSLSPDKLICELVEQAIVDLKSDKHSRGYILDGAVRTIPQAEFALGKSLIEHIFYFSLPKGIAKKRIQKRRLIEGRKEDLPKSMIKRFKDYGKQTLPTLEYLKDYSDNNQFMKYYKINASKEINEIHKDICRILKL